ncbi:hypothetical protein GQ85_11710 [Rhodococcus rhodochrous]|nr:hypothetical protein GQ85_11710 [Rhodococcus rhodochrous]
MLTALGRATAAHLDSLPGEPRVRARAQTGELVEDERALAVTDDAVPPPGAGAVGQPPQDRGGAAAPQGDEAIEKSRDGSREQYHQNDENNHSN